ncbi:dynamin family protein [Alkalihalophilus sp. As8PL]|uniref:Dynamin family protein n=1 Tax=Alkalihalophilus sp. As8PL TaxID=3237103 RepID=A0AB39BQB4_9BACI
MSFTLDVFQDTKRLVELHLEDLRMVLNEMEAVTEEKKVTEIKRSLMEDQFKVVVVGEFSRGKSTFINALLGKRVLPSFVRPTTAVLNHIIYKKEPTFTLFFQGSMKGKAVTDEQFNKLIAPKEPIEGDQESEEAYRSQVELLSKLSHIEIGFPLSLCENGVHLIDTPGTNDLDPVREQITNEMIPTSDAAILVLAATKILSESELSLLRDRILANDINKVFIVINFKDLLKSEDDIKKVMDYAKGQLKYILPDTKLYLVAAKEALAARRIEAGEKLTVRGREKKPWRMEDTGFLEFEQALADFLQYERGAIKVGKPVQQSIKVIDYILNDKLAFERQSLHRKVEDIQTEVKEFYPKVNEVKKKGKDTLGKIDFGLSKEVLELEAWYKEQLQLITKTALETFDEHTYLNEEEINRKIEDVIAPLERQLHQEKKEKFNETIKAIMKESSESFQKEWHALNNNIKQLVTVEPDQVSEKLPVITSGNNEAPSIFDEIYDELDDAWSNSQSVLGKVAVGAGYAITLFANGVTALFKSFLAPSEHPLVKMRRQLHTQFNQKEKKNLEQFQKQWKALSKATLKQSQLILDEQVKNVKMQLKQIEEHAQLEEGEVQQKLEVIHRREKRLLSIKKQLQTANKTLQKKLEEIEV